MYNTEMTKYFEEQGVSLVGFADLKAIGNAYASGIAIALKIPAEIIQAIENGPTDAYHDTYHALNKRLDEIAASGAAYIQSKGFKAQAQTTTYVQQSETYRTELPHKTVATRAGLGWIGKCALFINETYGSGIRLTSILTDMPFSYGVPTEESKCGTCDRCQTYCPGKAVSGKLWHSELDRDAFFNAVACREAARLISKEKIDKEITLCGKCIEICPYTQRYVKRTLSN
ncbi:epoxyqueuosine reductase [Fusibacter paucivorans]|uniref:Epoxyqueuosine reductase n=1 Tax=Fusibacter paucivorans TaxID=76009 RepID=A0ABS5PLW2_9FIRM|nr:4Fe-4S double cluster binding domain-containing protein [Fusibacter paucivorans]MBS7526154.1 epoxyqueuosine reductase [Fusibacter paucivorans]